MICVYLMGTYILDIDSFFLVIVFSRKFAGTLESLEVSLTFCPTVVTYIITTVKYAI